VKRRGIFLAEVLIAAGLSTLAVTALINLFGSGAHSTFTSVDSADAVRSASLAIEALRQDTRRLVFQRPEDLGIYDGGRRLWLLTPGEPSEDDPWNFPAEGVTWRLVPVVRHAGCYQLERQAPDGSTRIVQGCWLSNLQVRFVPAGQLAEGAFLDITVEGLPGPGGGNPCTLSFLAPVRKGGI